MRHRSPRAAHGAGTQSAVEEKSEVEGASAASINDGAGDAREADGRESDHGEEFARQRRVHQVTVGPGVDEERMAPEAAMRGVGARDGQHAIG